MDIVSPENRFLEEGKSDELNACFQIIQETTIDDVPKFTEKTCRDLARIIVCRSYATAILELCHLVVAAVHCGSNEQRYEPLFFSSGPARPSRLRAHFSEFHGHHDAIDISSNAVSIRYENRSFTVTYSRMPLLSALMEFLMTSIGYGDLDDALAPAVDRLPSHKSVSEMANGLSRRVYEFLGAHLPPVQEQRKSQSFLWFISENTEEFSSSQVSDEAVLRFWLTYSGEQANEQAVDVKTYRSVFRMASQLTRILHYAEEQYKIKSALPIGTDFEAGEIDPGDFEQALLDIEAGPNFIDALNDVAGTGVKIVNKREINLLRDALQGDDVNRMLTRSLIRNAVFGEAQATLVQALRISSAFVSDETISDVPNENYTDQILQYSELATHLDHMLHACLHVLLRAQNSMALSVALELKPDLDVAALSEHLDEPDWEDENIVSFKATDAAAQFFEQTTHPTGDLKLLAETAETAYKTTSRQGFKAPDPVSDIGIELFSAGAAALIAARRELNLLLTKYLAAVDWRDQFASDLPQFRSQFTSLYGGQDG